MSAKINTYAIGYFSKRMNAYTYKFVRAENYDLAIKKSRIKNIEEIDLVEKGANGKWVRVKEEGNKC